jgi:hypothetical protein
LTGDRKFESISLQPSSRESVSLPHPLSKVENPGFPRRFNHHRTIADVRIPKRFGKFISHTGQQLTTSDLTSQQKL